MKRGEDWLTGDARNDVSDTQKKEQQDKAVEFAQLYLCFVDDPRARELLDHWDKTIRRRRIAVSSSIQEYAAHNAIRDFIEQIQQQIEIAQKGKLN